MSNIEDILATQNQLKEAIEQHLRNFKKDGAERKTPTYIKKRLETLDSYWVEFQANHTQLYQYEGRDYPYFTENDYLRTKECYNDARSFIQQYQGNLHTREASPAKPAISITETQPQLLHQHLGEPSTYQEQPTTNKPTTFVKTKSQGNASKTDEMLRKQKSNFKAFTKTITTIDLDSINEKWEFDDTLKNLESRWKVIDSLHWEIDCETTGEELEYEQIYEIYEHQYKDMKKAVNTKMWSVAHKQKSTPVMDLPTFGGAYHHWVSFKDLFTETVHTNPSLSSAQKMQYLKSKVKGEAEKLIQHLSISSDNYAVCWDILNNRYNNKKLIFTSHLSTILNLPTIQFQTSLAIKRVHDTAYECLNAIKNLGVDISTWDPIMVHLLSQKLDSDTYNDYIESLTEPRELPSLPEFLRYLETKFTSLETARRKQERQTPEQQQRGSSSNNRFQPTYKAYSAKANQNFNSKPKSSNNSNNNYSTLRKTSYVPSNVRCPLCKNEHGLFHCNDFIKLHSNQRRNLVAKLNLCTNCLFDHKGKQCNSAKTCRQCNAQHHTLLHDTSVNSMPTASNDGHNNRNATTSSGHVSMEHMPETLLATALIKVKTHNGSEIVLRALIDQGSQVSLISENACQLLGLRRQRCKGVIFGVGTQENNCKGAVTISSTAINNNYNFDTYVYVMRNLINNLPNRSFPKPSSWKHLEGIQLADPDYNINQPVHILFGADVYSNIILSGVIKGEETQPIAQQTLLGWILCGNIKSYQCNVVLNNLDDISSFWKIEDIADNTLDMSSEDLYCLQQYKTETKRNKDGRYEVRLPLHPDIKEKLGESKPRAAAQFFQLERRLQRAENIAKNYKQFMTEYEQLNHMQLCNSNTKPHYYLPHSCVQRVDSTTTPLRVIFNASSKTTSGESLNSLMFSGPNLQTDLMSIILKWRQYKIAFTADIEKMFRQILCHRDDQNYQKILWRDTPDQPLREYSLSTLVYGTKAAPYLAMMTLKQLASDERHNYPEAAAILESSFYMDDLLCSTDNLETATRIKTDLTNLLKAGGFNLRKWSSNNLELLGDNKSTNTTPEPYNFRHQESTKTLGLRWNPYEDNFTFQLTIDTNSTKPVTKRFLLSEISKVFDPLGWLSPLTTKLKLIFQAVWQQELRWDDEVPESINKEWGKIKSQLSKINHLQIPRWLHIKQEDDIELHGFCDSSESAYACVIYCKTRKNNSVVLVSAKSRLVPAKKTISLPRLELCAAQLLSTLMEKVKQCLSNHNATVYGWTDSTAVLGWLHGDHNRWKPFVSHRVQKITTTMPATCWNYVKTSENPADCASRGISPTQLTTHQLWWHGPEWLPTYLPVNNQQKYETNEEMKKLQTNVIVKQNNNELVGDLLARNSCLTRVTRVIAWMLRVTSLNEKRPNYLTIPEMKKASNILVKYIQRTSFEDDISKLEQKKQIDRKSKLLPLNPFLDQNGLLKVGGRINNANIDAEQKNPLIIPHDGHFTELLIDHAHKMTFHGGARLTSARLRKQYWIIGGNRAVKKRIFNCVKCRKHNPIQQSQLMGDLPAARCNPTRPFYHTGVDYTGYIDVKTNKGRGITTTKGYIAVFVCMVTKAVHLELVSDLSSSAFLSALRRLAARRGSPGHIYSDNGTNFVGANNILKQEFIDLKTTINSEFLSAVTDMNIKWHFNAPSWPSAGGLWESSVKSLKFHLRRVLGEQKLTYEELSTLLSQLEACLNSRPLLALTEVPDPEEIDFLTPSHFLSSGPTLTIMETERDLITRWQLVQKIFQDIWKRWQSEYLTQLNSRGKWQQAQKNMSVDDIVIIHDANLPPGKWALGRVIDLHEGKDGYVRVVTLRTKNGTLKRPVTKLSKLPVKEHESKEKQGESDSKQTESEENKQQNNDEQEQKTSETTKGRKSKRSCYLVWAIISILTFVSPARCDHSITNINKNQSIYFDKVTDMHLIRDEWKLVVYYDMAPFWQGIKIFKSYITSLETTCSSLKKQNQCELVLLQLRHGFTELAHNNNVLLEQKLSITRQRRGLINGIGSIANSLFGVLDQNFAEKYEQDIASINKNEKHLALLWKNQTSIVEAENNILKRVEQMLEKQHKMYNQHLISLDKATNTIASEVQDTKITNDFTLMSIIANSILINLKSLQETLLETVTDIHYGKLNIHILTPQQLTEELNIISGHLSKDLTLPIGNIHTDLRKLYHFLKVKARMSETYFIFEIKIPLVTRDFYDIYKLIPIPQQIQESMVTIEPIADRIAINLQKDAYLPMTENELQMCTPDNLVTLMCPLQRPIYHLKSDDNLCVKNKETNQCETKQTTCTDMWIELYKINTYLYFCCGQRTIRIICEHQVTAERVSKAGIITLGEGCVIKGETFTIYSHTQRANYLRVQPDVIKVDIPPINYIFNITIPVIGTNKTADDELSTFKTELNQIDKQIEKMKSEGDGIDPITSHDVHQYALLYILLGTTLCVGGLFLWRRARARCSVTLPSASDNNRQPSVPAIQLVELPAVPETRRDDVESSVTRPYACVDRSTSPVTNRMF